MQALFQTEWMARRFAKEANAQEAGRPRYEPGPDVLPPDIEQPVPLVFEVEELPPGGEFSYRVVDRERAA